jgi:hypothetical protein
MGQRIVLLVVGLVWACGGVACAPKLVGPTPGAGYVFSLHVSNSVVWLGHVDMALAAYCPPAAVVFVQVQDAQGRPVDGVPVTFVLEPDWVQSASLAPTSTQTRGGRAWAIFSAPQTIGAVRIMAQVDALTAQTTLTVMTCEEPPWSDRD